MLTPENQKKFTLLGFVVFFLLIIALFGYRYHQSTKPRELPNIPQNKLKSAEEMEKQKATERLPYIEIEEARNQLYTLFVDIRPIEAYRDHRVRNSIHITDFSAEEEQFGIKNIILIYAGTEDRPQELQRVVNSLSQFYPTRILRGGFPAWSSANLPTIKRANLDSVEDVARVQIVEPRDVDALLQGDTSTMQVIDVRSKVAYERERITGDTLNIPLTELEKNRRSIPLNKTLYIYGQNDLESFEASILLLDLGFIDNYMISGGLNAWKEFDYPTITP